MFAKLDGCTYAVGVPFEIKRKGFMYSHKKSEEPLKSKKTCCISFIRTQLSIFVKLSESCLVAQSLLTDITALPTLSKIFRPT